MIVSLNHPAAAGSADPTTRKLKFQSEKCFVGTRQSYRRAEDGWLTLAEEAESLGLKT